MQKFFSSEAVRQSTVVVLGSKVRRGYNTDGKYSAHWFNSEGKRVEGAFKAMRNQQDTNVDIVVHPVNGYTASRDELWVKVTVYAWETYRELIFDKIMAEGTSDLNDNQIFYPISNDDMAV